METNKLFFILLIFAVVTACGVQKETAPAEEAVPPAETVQEDTPSKPGTGLFLEIEHPAYDPSLTRYT